MTLGLAMTCFFFYLIFYIFFWLQWILIAVLGLFLSSRSEQRLLELWQVGLVAPRHMGSQLPDQESNLGPLQ